MKKFLLLLLLLLLTPSLTLAQDKRPSRVEVKINQKINRQQVNEVKKSVRVQIKGNSDQKPLEPTQNSLKNNLKKAIHLLEKLGRRLENSNLSGDQKQLLLDQINQELSWFKEKQSAVESAQTFEQLEALARQLEDHWQDTQTTIKNTTYQLLLSRLQAALTKTNELNSKLNQIFTDSGFNLPSADKTSNLLEDTATQIESAQNSFDQATTALDNNPNDPQIPDLFKQTHSHIKSIFQNFKQLINLIRDNTNPDQP